MGVLVLPAASRPSMRSRISRDPKILPIIFDIWFPIVAAGAAVAACAGTDGGRYSPPQRGGDHWKTQAIGMVTTSEDRSSIFARTV